jgi:hypothetical protein
MIPQELLKTCIDIKDLYILKQNVCIKSAPHEMWRGCGASALRMLPERHPVPQTATPHDPLVWAMSIAVLRSHKKSRCSQAI